MALERYVQHGLVLLPPSTSVHEAARSLRSTHVGALVVEDHQRAIGIVTDRDLTLRVLGRGLAPDRVSLGQVMTPDVATLYANDSEEAAAALMRSLGVRRVPIVDHTEKALGIVTLDDLVVARLAPELLEGVVAAQRESPGGEGTPRRTRALEALQRFEERLRAVLELASRESALEAFYVVASGIVRRLNPSDAHDFISQLPALVRERLYELPPGPDRKVTLTGIDDEMAKRLQLSFDEAAKVVDRVAAALPLFVSEGELEDVRSHLPWRLRRLIRLAA